MKHKIKKELGGDDREKYDKILEKAAKNKKYRLKLKAEPISVLREAGIEVPEGVEVRIREFDPQVRYLFLPPMND